MMDQYLRRYTNLPVLLDILENQKLTLLDPQDWEDKNDSHYLKIYKTKLGLKSVLALCFTEAGETYHHWKVFSGNSAGICIQFNKEKLFECFNKVSGMKKDSVIYKKIPEVKAKRPINNELPFLKRYQFRDEKEFRFVYGSKLDVIKNKDVSINPSCIEMIIFNPWIPKPVFESVKMVIRKINGCNKIRISRSTLIDNEAWKKISEK
jgi:hypothetical protein